jgi:hypothetical protein
MTLTHQQMHDVKAAAGMLPTYQREGFLLSVANRLRDLPSAPPSDADVHCAIRFVLSVRGVSAPRSLRCVT